MAATRGRSIIISSGARRSMELRAPNDVVNLVHLFGTNEANARLMVGHNPRDCLKRAQLRRTGGIFIDNDDANTTTTKTTNQ